MLSSYKTTCICLPVCFFGSLAVSLPGCFAAGPYVCLILVDLMVLCPPVYLSVCLSVSPYFCTYLHSSIKLSVVPSVCHLGQSFGCLPVSLSVCMLASVTVCLSVCLPVSVCLFVWLYVWLSVCVCMFVCLCVCMSFCVCRPVCLSVCVYIHPPICLSVCMCVSTCLSISQKSGKLLSHLVISASSDVCLIQFFEHLGVKIWNVITKSFVIKKERKKKSFLPTKTSLNISSGKGKQTSKDWYYITCFGIMYP